MQTTLASARQALTEGPTPPPVTCCPRLLQLSGTEDAREGVPSFIERREAHFTGR